MFSHTIIPSKKRRAALHTKQRGFTIIELVTVIVVMAFVLAGIMGVTLYSTLRSAQVVNAAEMNLSFQTTLRYITNELRYSFPVLFSASRRNELTVVHEDGTTRNIFMVETATVDSLYIHPNLTQANYSFVNSSDPKVTHSPHGQDELDQMPRLLAKTENMCITYRDAEFPLGEHGTGHLTYTSVKTPGDAMLHVPQVVDVAIHAYIPGSPIVPVEGARIPRVCIQERVLLEPTARYGLARVPKVQRYVDATGGFNAMTDEYTDLCAMMEALGKCDVMSTPNY